MNMIKYLVDNLLKSKSFSSGNQGVGVPSKTLNRIPEEIKAIMKLITIYINFLVATTTKVFK